jgi:hypothetical protein
MLSQRSRTEDIQYLGAKLVSLNDESNVISRWPTNETLNSHAMPE